MKRSFSKTYKHIFMSVFELAQSQMSLAGHEMPLRRFGRAFVPSSSVHRGAGNV
jgi:hypothetical protein